MSTLNLDIITNLFIYNLYYLIYEYVSIKKKTLNSNSFKFRKLLFGKYV